MHQKGTGGSQTVSGLRVNRKAGAVPVGYLSERAGASQPAREGGLPGAAGIDKTWQCELQRQQQQQGFISDLHPQESGQPLQPEHRLARIPVLATAIRFRREANEAECSQ